MAKNSRLLFTQHTPKRFFLVACLLFSLMTFAGCGGGTDDSAPPPSNVGGGFTLVASGGTLNDGSGVKGLSVLITLRDGTGNGPGGAAGWQITITGPGINPPLVVSYDDGSSSSYSTWWWEQFDPLSGTYTATATNGVTTLTYHFNVNAAQALPQPVLNKSGSTVSWNPVTGAKSYYYEVTDGTGIPVTWGYLASDSLVSQYFFTIPSLTDDGSYLVSVYALTKDRLALGMDTNPSPSLPSQENDSLATIDFVQNGTGSGYDLQARGGVLYEDSLYSVATGTIDYYGLVIWTSIFTTSTPSTPPAGDWHLSVTGPGITTPISYTYPKTDSHYIYWDFGTAPAAGTYTVTASPAAGGTPITQTFTIPFTTAQLPIAKGLIATPTNGGGASVNWNSVAGANSYYVNIWAEVDGIYTEIAGGWVNSNSVTLSNGTLIKGGLYDVYVTACQLDMTDMNSMPPPVSPGTQVNMSDTTFTYVTITAL